MLFGYDIGATSGAKTAWPVRRCGCGACDKVVLMLLFLCICTQSRTGKAGRATSLCAPVVASKQLPTGALVSMTSETLSGTDWYSLSTLETGIFVSGSLGGALVASALAL
eukprot:4188842-Pyramimonas_sp.AAC.1